MLSLDINYEDLNGRDRTETAYFNLTKTEATRWALKREGDIEKEITDIVEREDLPALFGVFDELIDISYGVRSDDGQRFIKSPELLAEFKSSMAYDQFLFDLFASEGAAVNFFRGVFPKEVIEAADAKDLSPRERSERVLQGFMKKSNGSKEAHRTQMPEQPTFQKKEPAQDGRLVTSPNPALNMTASAQPVGLTDEQREELRQYKLMQEANVPARDFEPGAGLSTQ